MNTIYIYIYCLELEWNCVTRTHTHAQTHKHSRTHTNSHTNAPSPSQSQSRYPLAGDCHGTNVHVPPRFVVFRHFTHTHTHIYTHTHTHTHTHTLTYSHLNAPTRRQSQCPHSLYWYLLSHSSELSWGFQKKLRKKCPYVSLCTSYVRLVTERHLHRYPWNGECGDWWSWPMGVKAKENSQDLPSWTPASLGYPLTVFN